jgi:hypothetical protein
MQFRGMPGVGRSLALPAGFVAVGLAGTAAWWAFGHDRRVGVAAVSAGLFGLGEAIRSLRSLIDRRRRADDWLRTATGRVVPPAYELGGTPREVLAQTLEEGSELTPAGMLRVTTLVTDGRGPLWGASDDALEAEVETALSLLRAA